MAKWKEVYESCNHNKYSRIIAVNQEIRLRSDVRNFIKGKWLYILLAILILAFFLLFIFQNNLLVALYSFLFLLFIAILVCYYNTYSIRCTNKNIQVRMNFQDTIIEYSQLFNIYMQKEIARFCFIPITFYSIAIIYQIQEDKIVSWKFPTIFLKKAMVKKFFDNFAYSFSEEQEQQQEKEDKVAKKAKRIMIAIVLVVILVAGLLGYFFIKNM